MPLPGGPADKLGNRYEAWWVMAELARMLRGESETVRIEPPGRDKVDLIVATELQTEYHQVKRVPPRRLPRRPSLGIAHAIRRRQEHGHGR